MRKVIKESGDWVSLSCPYLFITFFSFISGISNSLECRYRFPGLRTFGSGPGVKLLYGSTCYNFPPYVGCVLLYFIWAHVCQLFVGSAANTLTMCQSARFVVIAEAWWDCKMGFPSALEAVILWQLDLWHLWGPVRHSAPWSVLNVSQYWPPTFGY